MQSPTFYEKMKQACHRNGIVLNKYPHLRDIQVPRDPDVRMPRAPRSEPVVRFDKAELKRRASNALANTRTYLSRKLRPRPPSPNDEEFVGPRISRVQRRRIIATRYYYNKTKEKRNSVIVRPGDESFIGPCLTKATYRKLFRKRYVKLGKAPRSSTFIGPRLPADVRNARYRVWYKEAVERGEIVPKTQGKKYNVEDVLKVYNSEKMTYRECARRTNSSEGTVRRYVLAALGNKKS